MKFKFNKVHSLTFIFLFIVEILIAIYFKTGFIRHTVGDFLVVIVVYSGFRSFIHTKPLYIAIVTFIIAYTTEFLQTTNFLHTIGLGENKLANIIFGNSFSIQDLVAYTIGILLIWVIDRSRFFSTRSNKNGRA